MYSSFVLYLPEDGQMVGRGMYEVTVLYKLISKRLCASVGTAYIYILRLMQGLWIIKGLNMAKGTAIAEVF